MLRAEFNLPSITDEEAAPDRKAPIRVKFEIPYFTVSGIQVRPRANIFYRIKIGSTWMSFVVLLVPVSVEFYLPFDQLKHTKSCQADE